MKYNIQEKVINEIVNFIGNNIKIYLSISDEYFNKLQKYVYDNEEEKQLSYDTLLILTEEVLYELSNNCYQLYDLREIKEGEFDE